MGFIIDFISIKERSKGNDYAQNCICNNHDRNFNSIMVGSIIDAERQSSNFLIKMRALAVIVILLGVTILCIGFIILMF